MKKILLSVAALMFAGLLAGCNQLTQYTLNEQEINDYLKKHNEYQKQISVPGLLDAYILLAQLHSQIGRSEPGKFTLKLVYLNPRRPTERRPEADAASATGL